MKLLWRVSYTADGAKGVLKEGGSARREAAKQVAESVGGKLEAFYFAYGDDDVIVIADMPNNEAAIAASLAVSSSGAARISSTVLLTPEEFDKATSERVTYRPPGA